MLQKAHLKSAIAGSKDAKKNLDDSRLFAPDDGIIMTRIQEPGAVVEPSMPIYTMARIKPIWVRVYIPDIIGNIRYGMKANVYTDTMDPKRRTQTLQDGRIYSPVARIHA